MLAIYPSDSKDNVEHIENRIARFGDTGSIVPACFLFDFFLH